ncbi:MAG: CapA family protein [Alistipes sp.]|nr:CapA family protein [Alistipes sp.]
MRYKKIFLAALAALGALATKAESPSAPSDPIAPRTRSARLMFAGDVMSHEPQLTAARAAHATRATDTLTAAPAAHDATSHRGYDYTDVFRHFQPIFSDADVAIANLETTLRTSPPYTGYPAFAAPAALAFDLRRAGVRIVTTANNHICDKGAAGIRSTLAILDSADIAHTGTFIDSTDYRARHPLYFTANGLRFALLAYTYGVNSPSIPRGVIVNTIDTAIIARDISLARTKNPDCIIISYHWGDEYRSRPNNTQRQLAEWTHSRGADIIIGSHPHVVEPIEVFFDADSLPRRATYYSLGNFVSNQRTRRTDGGIVADITVSRPAPYPLSYNRLISTLTPHLTSITQPPPTQPLTFNFAWRLAWVNKFQAHGHPHYEVLPAPTLDSLPPAAQFARDTRSLLSDSPAVEK